MVAFSGAGTDTVSTTPARCVVPTNVENLVFAGAGAFAGFANALDNTVTDGRGGDVLYGRAGADHLVGGAGNDSCHLDNPGDRAVETSGGGSGRVYSRLDHKLEANLEKLILNTGTAIVVEGSELANTIVGNANTDRPNGEAGVDMLTGRGGGDVVVFRTALGSGNVDVIADFCNAAGDNDRIEPEKAVFSALKTTVILSAGAFAANITELAAEADDRIISETATGRLYCDANGLAAGGEQLFANLTANLRLSSADLFVT